ncbi:MAG: chemotaxis response regulator protein-glutamate methylesterase [Chloroflexota bacterium]|nr:MAG: chemotaxis response regulator protein-glutamate methylesterase [Chloroflexota bacterium]
MIEQPVTSKRIRVLVVDDSAFMRVALARLLASDPGIEVIDTAHTGTEAVKKVLELQPDVVTMDVEMPGMNGLAALREIMHKRPTPVLMVSSLTTEGAQATLEALELGAVDFIPKQLSQVSLDIVRIQPALVAKVRAAAAARPRAITRPASGAAPARWTVRPDSRVKRLNAIAIGSSTGGPKALQEVIPNLPARLSIPVLVVQHMPPTFTGPMADRLNRLSAVNVKEAVDGEPLISGTVYIAPGGWHLEVSKQGALCYVKLSKTPAEVPHIPSVDVMMLSVARSYAGSVLGIILTGMGSDGLQGMTEIKRKGGVTIAQDEQTSCVYGMPQACVQKGVVDYILPLNQVADAVRALTSGVS